MTAGKHTRIIRSRSQLQSQLKPQLKFFLCAVLFVLAINGRAAIADDIPKIGRIFMSGEQREALDRMRLQGQPGEQPGRSRTATTDTGTSKQPTTVSGQKRNATGFIIPPNGKKYSWSNGEFRQSASTQVSALQHGKKSGPDEKRIDSAPSKSHREAEQSDEKE